MSVAYISDYQTQNKYNDGLGEGYNLQFESELWEHTYHKIKERKERQENMCSEREHIKAWLKLLSN